MTDCTRRLPDTIHIARGAHSPGDPTAGDPACTMEWVAWLAGEPWGDGPECTHPVITAVVHVVNDRLDDEPRQQLVELIPVLGGTADTRDDLLARQQLSVRLAAWCAEQVLHLAATADRPACERAIAAARVWADNPCPQTRAAARVATASAASAATATAATPYAYAAFYAAYAYTSTYYAATAAFYAATATDDPIGLLRGLVAEHTRLTTQEAQ